MIYKTKKNEVLDHILWCHFGFDKVAENFDQVPWPQFAQSLPDGYMEEVYKLNPTLCFVGVYLPEGLSILLPDDPIEEKTEENKSAWW